MNLTVPMKNLCDSKLPDGDEPGFTSSLPNNCHVGECQARGLPGRKTPRVSFFRNTNVPGRHWPIHCKWAEVEKQPAWKNDQEVPIWWVNRRGCNLNPAALLSSNFKVESSWSGFLADQWFWGTMTVNNDCQPLFRKIIVIITSGWELHCTTTRRPLPWKIFISWPNMFTSTYNYYNLKYFSIIGLDSCNRSYC